MKDNGEAAKLSTMYEQEDTIKKFHCPICFNCFLPSNIEYHAATCTGKSVDPDKPEESIQNDNSNPQKMKPGKGFFERQTNLSSFFKPPLTNKRPASSTENKNFEDSSKFIEI